MRVQHNSIHGFHRNKTIYVDKKIIFLGRVRPVLISSELFLGGLLPLLEIIALSTVQSSVRTFAIFVIDASNNN